MDTKNRCNENLWPILLNKWPLKAYKHSEIKPNYFLPILSQLYCTLYRLLNNTEWNFNFFEDYMPSTKPWVWKASRVLEICLPFQCKMIQRYFRDRWRLKVCLHLYEGSQYMSFCNWWLLYLLPHCLMPLLRAKWLKPLLPPFRFSLRKARAEDHQRRWGNYLWTSVTSFLYPDLSVDSLSSKVLRALILTWGPYTFVFYTDVFLYTLCIEMFQLSFSLKAPDSSFKDMFPMT